MNDCINLSLMLKDYPENNFTTQFDVYNNKNVTALGFGFFNPEPVQSISLIQPTS